MQELLRLLKLLFSYVKLMGKFVVVITLAAAALGCLFWPLSHLTKTDHVRINLKARSFNLILSETGDFTPFRNLVLESLEISGYESASLKFVEKDSLGRFVSAMSCEAPQDEIVLSSGASPSIGYIDQLATVPGMGLTFSIEDGQHPDATIEIVHAAALAKSEQPTLFKLSHTFQITMPDSASIVPSCIDKAIPTRGKLDRVTIPVSQANDLILSIRPGIDNRRAEYGSQKISIEQIEFKALGSSIAGPASSVVSGSLFFDVQGLSRFGMEPELRKVNAETAVGIDFKYGDHLLVGVDSEENRVYLRHLSIVEDEEFGYVFALELSGKPDVLRMDVGGEMHDAKLTLLEHCMLHPAYLIFFGALSWLAMSIMSLKEDASSDSGQKTDINHRRGRRMLWRMRTLRRLRRRR